MCSRARRGTGIVWPESHAAGHGSSLVDAPRGLGSLGGKSFGALNREAKRTTWSETCLFTRLERRKAPDPRVMAGYVSCCGAQVNDNFRSQKCGQGLFVVTCSAPGRTKGSTAARSPAASAPVPDRRRPHMRRMRRCWYSSAFRLSISRCLRRRAQREVTDSVRPIRRKHVRPSVSASC